MNEGSLLYLCVCKIRLLTNILVLFTGCRLEMVGSSICGFCLKTSDVNIDIVMDDNQSPSAALLAVRDLVADSDTYM